jgi:hypothetical protein
MLHEKKTHTMLQVKKDKHNVTGIERDTQMLQVKKDKHNVTKQKDTHNVTGKKDAHNVTGKERHTQCYR